MYETRLGRLLGLYVLLLVGIAVKLTWEQIAGEMPFSGDIVGGPVVVDAHLWGSVGGLIAVSIDALWRRARARL